MQEAPNEMDHHQDLIKFALKTIAGAGDVAEKYFRKTLQIDSKGDQFDPVTKADKEIESYIRDCITTEYPEHSITGEEQEDYKGASDYHWIIDPIDGTRSFISGVPTWGILLGLMQSDSPLLGFMHQPYTSEIYMGSEAGAYLLRNDHKQKLSCKNTNELKDAIIYTTHPEHFDSDNDLSLFLKLANSCQLSRYGGDCYSYCLLALGTVDLVVETGLAPYDIIPLIPIIESAGGIVTNWDGETVVNGGRIIAASNQTLYDQAISRLQN